MAEVIHVIGVLDRGGAETVALDLCRSIPPTDVRQTFVCLAGREGAIAEEFRAAGATIVPISLRQPVQFVRRFFQLVRDRQPCSVVSHVSLASGPILVLARLAGARQRIARMHSDGDGRTARWRHAYRWAARMTVALGSTHVLGVTEGSLDFGVHGQRALARLLNVHLGVLPNGVDVSRFRNDHLEDGSPGSITRVMHVGRAAPEKNRTSLPGIQRAFSDIQPNHFVLFGSETDGDLGEYDHNSLLVAGFTNTMHLELRTTDVLILPSIREGLPGVILEALAAGVPVVASDLDGIREIHESTSGVELVDLSATPEEWAAALARASRLPPSARRRISSDFEHSPFTLDRTLAKWRALWQA